MSHGDKRASVAPEVHASQARPRARVDGPLRRLPPPPAPRSEERALEKPALEKPSKDVQQCIRHDARSAYHSLSGFIELLSRSTLGPISEEQQLALAHIRSSANRLMELTESSVELGQREPHFSDAERRLISFEGLLLTIVNSMMREQPPQRIELQIAPCCHGLASYVEPEELTRTLRILIAVLAGPSQRELQFRLSQTELHVVLVLSTLRDEGSITQSMPISTPISSVDSASDSLESRDYVRLKRCESMLQRQQGGLLVADDLSRIRIAISKHGQ